MDVGDHNQLTADDHNQLTADDHNQLTADKRTNANKQTHRYTNKCARKGKQVNKSKKIKVRRMRGDR